MSYALSNSIANKKRRKHLKKKKLLNRSILVKQQERNSRISVSTPSDRIITVADAQRKNRQAMIEWKAKARKMAFSTAIGIHVVAIIILGIWFINKTVLQNDLEKIQGIVVDPPKSQNKRTFAPRKTQKTVKPRVVEVTGPKMGVITSNTNLSLGPADFTIPVSDLPEDNSRTFLALTNKTSTVEKSRHIEITSTIPKFELPKFEDTSLNMTMDMGTSLASMELNGSEELGINAVVLGEARQSFAEFLRLIRQRIKEEQRFPPNVHSLDEGVSTTIRFTLLRDGTLREPKVSISSGSRVLDNAALAAVKNAEPYPPFPEGQTGNSIRLELPVVFELAN